METWVPLEGFEKRYETSGNLIRTKITHNLVKPQPNGTYQLYNDAKVRLTFKLDVTKKKEEEKVAAKATAATSVASIDKKDKTPKEKKVVDTSKAVEEHAKLATAIKAGDIVFYTDKDDNKEKEATVLRVRPSSHDATKIMVDMKDEKGGKFMRVITKVRKK